MAAAAFQAAFRAPYVSTYFLDTSLNENEIVTQHAEAIFEDGLLACPVDDHRRFGSTREYQPEKEWLRVHGQNYSGQWVALNGEELLSHGSDARCVRDEARAKGVQTPLMVHIPDEPNVPSAFWV